MKLPSDVLSERIRCFNRLLRTFFQNQKLLLENQLLREKTHGLVVENQELRQRLGMDALATEEEEEEETKASISFIWWRMGELFLSSVTWPL